MFADIKNMLRLLLNKLFRRGAAPQTASLDETLASVRRGLNDEGKAQLDNLVKRTANGERLHSFVGDEPDDY